MYLFLSIVHHEALHWVVCKGHSYSWIGNPLSDYFINWEEYSDWLILIGLIWCYLLLWIRYRLHQSQICKGLSHECKSNLTVKVCWLNAASVCLCCGALSLLPLPICLPACRSASRLTCMLLLSLVSSCQEGMLSLFRRVSIMWWNRISTQRGLIISQFTLSLLFSIPPTSQPIFPTLLLPGIVFFPQWCFCVCLLFPPLTYDLIHSDLVVQKNWVFHPTWAVEVDNSTALCDLATARCLITAINREAERDRSRECVSTCTQG